MNNRTRWLVASVVFSPMLLVYALHFIVAKDGGTFTGFLHYDQPSYMAFAREYFDDGFSITYGLPFTFDQATPRIYFQPHTLLLGWIVWITGSDPGLVYVLFGILAGICMFRIAINLLEAASISVAGTAGLLTCICFLWGGGLLWIPGAVAALTSETPATYAFLRKAIFAFDPFFGFWFLNLGRNVYFSVEAYYHCLFLAGIIFILKKKYILGLTIAAALAISHPFTGVEFLLVLAGFSLFEKIRQTEDRPPTYFLVSVLLLLAAHIGYYLVFLNLASDDHRQLQTQWALSWTVDLISLLYGYGPIGVLALLALRRQGLQYLRQQRTARFCLIWFIICLGLVKHDLLIPPHQPVHFTRGYVWTPLFLLAAPLIRHFFEDTVERHRRVTARIGAILFMVVFVSDNLLWFSRSYLDAVWQYSGLDIKDDKAFYLTAEARATFDLLASGKLRDSLLVSNDPNFSYLATVYTPLRAWRSHSFATPHEDTRLQEIEAFLKDDVEPPVWKIRPLTVVINRSQDTANVATRLPGRGFDIIADHDHYVTFHRPAALSR